MSTIKTAKREIIAASAAAGKFSAEGLTPGQCVGVLYSRSGNLQGEAAVMTASGSVNGCMPSPGMVGRRMTLPWRDCGCGSLPGDLVAVLADGTEVRRHQEPGKGDVTYVAAEKTYRSVLGAALALTPVFGS